MQMIQHYTEHAKQVNDMHVSAVLRKISTLFRDGQVIQNKYSTCEDITKLKWLLVPERINFTIAKRIFKYIFL